MLAPAPVTVVVVVPLEEGGSKNQSGSLRSVCNGWALVLLVEACLIA